MDVPDSFITIFITHTSRDSGKQTSPGIDLELLASFGLESLAGLEQMDQAERGQNHQEIRRKKLMKSWWKAELIF